MQNKLLQYHFSQPILILHPLSSPLLSLPLSYIKDIIPY